MTRAHVYSHVPVALGDRSYEIIIGRHIITKLASSISSLEDVSRVIIITDTNIESSGILEDVESTLAGIDVPYHAMVINAGEASKSFETIERLSQEILSLDIDRKSLLVALGGGVIGDITGFLASIILRGIRFIQMPTTLLAMVDSSVGGKTGINTPHGKNLVGSFYQPQMVLADMAFLETLPKREWLAGYAEVVKYSIIHKPDMFDWLVSQQNAVIEKDMDMIAECVKQSCESKAEIVSQDEREGGIRALLNLGHTFGHALEAETGYSSQLVHGEAVSVGMCMAMRFSESIGAMEEEVAAKLSTHLKGVGLPTTLADIDIAWDADKLLSHMRHDKKAEAGRLVFVLVKAIGESYIDKDVDPDVLLAFLKREIAGDAS